MARAVLQFQDWQAFNISGNESVPIDVASQVELALSNGTHDLLCLNGSPTLILNTTLTTLGPSLGAPQTVNPFNRLASSSANEFVYVYHQYNESYIFERIWQVNLDENGQVDFGSSEWKESNSINVPIKL